MALSAYGASARGKRAENQDNFLVMTSRENSGRATLLWGENERFESADDWPPAYLRLALADGMGGHANGRNIAEAAMSALIHRPVALTAANMRQMVLELHVELQQRFAVPDRRSPGCTLLLADIHRTTGRGVVLCIGDSRAYLIRRNTWRQVTYDHSPMEFAFRDGEVTETEYRQGVTVDSHRLAQALGYGSFGIIPDESGYKLQRFDARLRLEITRRKYWGKTAHADVQPIRMRPGDMMILGSDGLWSGSAAEGWPPEEAPVPSQQGAVALVSRALEKGAVDNVTAIVCGFE